MHKKNGTYLLNFEATLHYSLYCTIDVRRCIVLVLRILNNKVNIIIVILNISNNYIDDTTITNMSLGTPISGSIGGSLIGKTCTNSHSYKLS